MSALSSRVVKLDSVLVGVVSAIYVAWAAVFIARSSVETEQGRFFCLFDDAMISLRYAWNLAHGDGLVWNPGERVEGTTCFLFTLYMSVGALFLGKSAAALFVQVTGALLVLGVALLARWLSRSLGATPGLGVVTAAAVLAYYPLSYWSLLGMETGFLTALALGALLLALRLGSDSKADWRLGLLLGLMFATRPDAVFPAAAILGFRAGWILVRHRRLKALSPWLSELLPFAGIALLLTLFRLVYFGSPLPNTYELKMGGWPLSSRLENGWLFVAPFFESSRYLFVFALASPLLRRDGRRLLLCTFAGAVVASQIWVGGDAWPYWRLLVPGVVVTIVLAVDGMSALVGLLLRRERPSLSVAFALACSGAAIWAANRPFLDELRMDIPAYMVKLNRRSVKVGLKLSRYARPEASVAVRAAGAMPYYSGLRGVDVLGKSDRHIARLRPPPPVCSGTVSPGHNKYDLDYSIGKLRPDVIYDGLTSARYQPGIFEFVQKHYVQRGPFWFRRDSRLVHWDRLPP
jgi:arabinofuranosyltransferase